MSIFKFGRVVSIVFWLVWFVAVNHAATPVYAADVSASNKQGNCMKCHRRNGVVLGLHGNEALDIGCQDCHGEKGGHPRKANKLMVFSKASSFSIAEQSQPCLLCHDPQTLATVEWTHNAHADNLACSGCHQLHTEQDAILALGRESRSQLCVRCHLAE